MKKNRVHSVTNIKQVYNGWHINHKTIRGLRTEIQQILKILYTDHYVFRFIMYDVGKYVWDILWMHLQSIKVMKLRKKQVWIAPSMVIQLEE